MSGNYEFHPKGCHKYTKPSYGWNTKEQTPILLSSTEHLLKGSILSPIPVDDVSVKVEGEFDDQSPLV